LSLGAGCVNIGTVAHEFLHALAIWHEQSRMDRDNFVTVNYANIENTDEARKQFDKAPFSNNLNTPYDYYSIMHYHNFAFSANGQPTIVAKDSSIILRHSSTKTALTQSDVDGVRFLYKSTRITISTTASPTTSRQNCPSFVCPDSFSVYSGRCYKFMPTLKSWNNAKTDCESQGGYLMKINNQAEFEVLAKIYSNNGANRIWVCFFLH